MNDAAHVSVWQAPGLDFEALFWTYAFYSFPPIWNSHLKSKHFSLCSCTQSEFLVSCTYWQCSNTSICFLHPEPHPAPGILSLDGMFRFRGKTDPCKLCTGIQSVHSPRHCKLFIMIRPFKTRRACAHSAKYELAGSMGHLCSTRRKSGTQHYVKIQCNSITLSLSRYIQAADWRELWGRD